MYVVAMLLTILTLNIISVIHTCFLCLIPKFLQDGIIYINVTIRYTLLVHAILFLFFIYENVCSNLSSQ